MNTIRRAEAQNRLPPGMILLIDNYDSFTWNLVHRLAEADPTLRLGVNLRVVRNDELSLAGVEALCPSHIILSPGPCSPNETGICGAVIARFAGSVPILGVCLGHQTIGHVFGMRVHQHRVSVHGKTSSILHNSTGVFHGLPTPFTAARYHSLVIDEATIPRDSWGVTAWAHDGGTRVCMGIRRLWEAPGKAQLEGVQFHPESFMTPEGTSVLRNFLCPLTDGPAPVAAMPAPPAAPLSGFSRAVPSRLIAIDLGEKRTGLAAGDRATGVISPIGAVEVPQAEQSGGSLVAALARKIKEHADPGTLLVVGLPLNMDGTQGPAAKKAHAFAARLAQATGLAFVLHDERLTTVEADNRLARSGLTHGQKKARRDAIAAAALLEDYMRSHAQERQNPAPEPPGEHPV